ncbi:hypothetical protein BJP40_23105 [Streptomyces sp. CC53]|uniref:hypothetical protein n=1 Tax=unclassified Streptomyces TaxID=2593676 RepID=UPI0008DE1A32|nr:MULTISPECIES: hypothetical protein [unclassified Streptomyces]OII63733.1 hypothetical protein BJP40_23105 [Streptomyces sp. CC53]
MATSAHLLHAALSKQVRALSGQARIPSRPGRQEAQDHPRRPHPCRSLPAQSAARLAEPRFTEALPLTSEPPLADAAPLTSEPPMTDAAPLTSEPTARGTAGGPEFPRA